MTKKAQQKTIIDLLLAKESSTPDTVYLRQPSLKTWHEYTWREVMDKARRVAQFLLNQGFNPGTHVSIYSKNCAEWFITDFGITLAGMVNVPLFANQHPESIEYVLEHAAVKMIFVGKLDSPNKSFANLPETYPTVSFDYHKNIESNFTWQEVMANDPLVKVAKPKLSDLYTIIYSSGTTGFPKGVMFTHEAIINNVDLCMHDLMRHTSVKKHHRLLSYLPLAHVYERSNIQLASLCIDCDVSFVQSLEKFAQNLKDVQPTLFTAVPRIWDVFRQKIVKNVPEKKLNALLKIPFVAGKIKHKIKHQLGLSCCDLAVSGAAHLPTSLLSFFNKIGIYIQEGYGQTENFAYATLSMLNHRVPGCVGVPRYGVEIKLGESDELLLKSSCLMQGYYKDKKATLAAITSDGFLRTGDIVDIDEHNQVKIRGRISENFKNQKGEFVAPTPIEENFNDEEYIENTCLMGRSLPSNVLLVNLTADALNVSKDHIINCLNTLWRKVNRTLLAHEKISHLVVITDSWTTDNGCLTPTQKVKRRVIEARYQDSIKNSLKRASCVVWE